MERELGPGLASWVLEGWEAGRGLAADAAAGSVDGGEDNGDGTVDWSVEDGGSLDDGLVGCGEDCGNEERWCDLCGGSGRAEWGFAQCGPEELGGAGKYGSICEGGGRGWSMGMVEEVVREARGGEGRWDSDEKRQTQVGDTEGELDEKWGTNEQRWLLIS